MKHFFYLIFIIGFIQACDNTTPKDPLQVEIEDMEKQIGEDITMDTALAYNITDAYIAYANKYPQDTLSPLYLMKAANIYKEIRPKWLKAVNTYGRIHHEYPDHEITPQAVFMIGFIFDDKYHDRERAAKSYRYFLERYPDHELADDAKNLLILVEDTGSSDLKLIEKWMEKNDSSKQN